MLNFIRGIIVGALALAAGVYGCARFGYFDLRADQNPSAWEERIAMSAMDESTERHAAEQKNPLQPTQENLLAGARLYRDKCSDCHGSPVNPNSDYGRSFYPRVPQFMKQAPDMPDHENFYIIKHGVRWTAMPAWGNLMTDSEIWQVILVLNRFEKLPPEVNQELRKPVAAAPVPAR
jgi:mono/diheme cytochrome c family protein